MSAFGVRADIIQGKADIIQGKAEIRKCPLMTQSGHPVPRPTVETARGAGSRPNLAFILPEALKTANVHSRTFGKSPKKIGRRHV
jgi:hypothetical protein